MLGLGNQIYESGNYRDFDLDWLIKQNGPFVLVTGPGHYTLTRKLAAILKALAMVNSKIEIYSFDVLIDYLKRGVFVESKVAWVRIENNIEFMSHEKSLTYDLPSNLIGTPNYVDCSLQALSKNINNINLHKDIRIHYQDRFSTNSVII